MKNSLKKLFSFMKKYKFKFFASILSSVVYTLALSSQPFFIGKAVTELTKNVVESAKTGVLVINLEYIGKIILALIITGIFATIGDYLANYLLSEAVQDTTLDIRRAVYTKLNKLPVSYFDSRQQGEILSRVTTDITVVSEAMQQSLLQVLGALLTLAFSVIFMFILSPFFALIAMIIFPICIGLFKYLGKKGQPHFDDLQNSLGKLNGYTQEYFSGYMVVQLFGQEEKVIQGFEDVNDELNQSGFKANFISSTINPILSGMTHLGYAALFLLLGLTVLDGPLVIAGVIVAKQMEIGAIQSFIQYVWQASGPIGQITQLTNLFQTATSSLTRVMDILDEEEEKDIISALNVNDKNKNGEVEFKNVQFGYSKDKLLMENINIDVKSGDNVAIVGPTGAGKTTIINLLMRFYDIDGGKITIDGYNIDELSKKQTRSLFGVVDQAPWLYSTTIEENIKFGKLDATYEEVVETAKMAKIDHFIRTLPDGYRTLINEDTTNISQGEKQLITIARALLKDPEILILDEATSSVDTRLEQLLQKAMDKAMEGRTSFVIAHRLSTIRNADLILVMQEGSIVEQGNHDELIAQAGVYKDLYESQFA